MTGKRKERESDALYLDRMNRKSRRRVKIAHDLQDRLYRQRRVPSKGKNVYNRKRTEEIDYGL